MRQGGLQPHKSTKERQREIFSTGKHSIFSFDSFFRSKKQRTAHITVTAAQVIPVKGTSLMETRNHVINPAAATARTLEKIQPLSSKRQNSLPVTGIAAKPITAARSHQVQKVHTSPFRRKADAPSAAAASRILTISCIFLFFSLLCSINSDSPII